MARIYAEDEPYPVTSRLEAVFEPKQAGMIELRETDLTSRNDEELGAFIHEHYFRLRNFLPGVRYLRFEVRR